MFSVLTLLSSSISRADPPPGYHFLRYDEALRAAKQQNKKLFVYYGRYGCGFCDKTNKESFSNSEIHKLYTEHYVLAYVDAESGQRLTLPNGERLTEMELGARLKALVTPIFIFMENDGKILLKVPGFQTAKDFNKYDQYIYGGYYKNFSLAQFLEKNP
ncbi:MAG: thioredoxin fold domain-containing protein [Gammaproteobacteria bacterium]|nr:thioredoxin fold domain-containing protein [Gammaproteobacteria bacterium]